MVEIYLDGVLWPPTLRVERGRRTNHDRLSPQSDRLMMKTPA